MYSETHVNYTFSLTYVVACERLEMRISSSFLIEEKTK